MSKKRDKKTKKDQTRDSKKSNVRRMIVVAAIVVGISAAAGFILSGELSSSYPGAFGGEMRQTMSPGYYLGKTARAYRAAKEIPEVLDKIYCYCKCQENHGHKSLLTCFVDRHGSQCGICIDEALMAHDMRKKGYSTDRIVDKINSLFSNKLKNS